MNTKYEHWVPAAFCAALSLITVATGLFMDFTTSATHSLGAGLTFYGFLPMCFFFVGMITTRLQRESRELRKELAELRHASAHQEDVAQVG